MKKYCFAFELYRHDSLSGYKCFFENFLLNLSLAEISQLFIYKNK